MSSLRDFLDELPAGELLHVTEPVELDYYKTALALELDARQRSPVIQFDQPVGWDVPIVTNLLADRGRIARMAGTDRAGFNATFASALQNLIPAEVGADGPVHEVVQTGADVD